MGTKTFGYTGGWQTFNVPTGVTSFSIACDGAGSGSRGGGRVEGTFSCSDTDTLYILVGQAGIAGATGSTYTQSGGGATYGAGGAGGDGYNAHGGYSGGGYSAIRINSTAGTIVCIAGGAGGDSGDGGAGGLGGSSVGLSGGRGNAGPNATTAATGGSQSSGGTGGTSSSGSEFNGSSATSGALTRAGAGGGTGGYDGPGGGGGGGGWYPGGGGCGGSTGWAPGGGGGGGSSNVSGLSSVTENAAGNGGTGNGSVILSWTDPAPNTPTSLSPANGALTLSTGSITLSATATTNTGDSYRLMIDLDNNSSLSSPTRYYSSYVASGSSASVSVTGLSTNTTYYWRVASQDSNGLSSGWSSIVHFNTDFSPSTPTNVVPADGSSTLSMGSLGVSATVNDSDGTNVRALFRWSTDNFATYTNVFSSYVAGNTTASATLTGLPTDTQISMNVYAQDPQGLYSSSPASVSFYTNRTPDAPTLRKPADNAILDSTISQPFSWTFSDPDSGDSQGSASLRYRKYNVGDTWTSIAITGSANSTRIAANTFAPNQQYEWQVRTTDAGGLVGPYSASRYLTASPPQVAISARASAVIQGHKAIQYQNTMKATARLSVTPKVTEVATLSMRASGQMVIHPASTISIPISFAARASLALPGQVTRRGILAMGAQASMQIPGLNSLSGQVFMSARGTLQFQQVDAENLMKATAKLTVLPFANITSSTVTMGAKAGVAISPHLNISEQVTIHATPAMTIGSSVSHQAALRMAANGAVVNSPGVSRTIPTPMAARAAMAVTEVVSHAAGVMMGAAAAMAVHGHENVVINRLAFSASTAMTVGGVDEIDSGGLPIAATAGMSISGEILVQRAVALSATAAMTAPQSQYVYEGPYLVTTDSQGDTISFSLNSYPNPRTITNTLTITETGGVAP